MGLGFFFTFLAAITASFSSLALSKTLHNNKATASGYLFLYFFTGFLISGYVNEIFSSKISFSVNISIIGAIVGLLIAALMFTMGQALKNGPSGLTFAFQNSGAILPPLFLTILFSKPFGFTLSVTNLLGMAFVILGLFLAANRGPQSSISKKWIFQAVFAFFIQGLILSIFQWRCLLLQEFLPSHLLIPFSCSPVEDLWFMPALFFSAWIYQTFYFFISEKRAPNLREIIGGSIGGIANGLSTFFLLRATFVASEAEKIMLFPLFTVVVIFLCNLYGKFFYQENIPWKANALAAFGILIGTMF